jgi:hypothetical protein
LVPVAYSDKAGIAKAANTATTVIAVGSLSSLVKRVVENRTATYESKAAAAGAGLSYSAKDIRPRTAW